MDHTAHLMGLKMGLDAREWELEQARKLLHQGIKDAVHAQTPVRQVADATGYTTARVYQILGKKEARI